MAPATKAKQLVKAPSKDIRSFFGGSSQAQSTPSRSFPPAQGVVKEQAIEILSEDDRPVTKKPPAKATPQKSPAKKPKVEYSMDEDDDRPQPKPAVSLKRKKKAVLLSSDDDEEVKVSPPKKKVAVAPSASTSKGAPIAKAKPSVASSSKPKVTTTKKRVEKDDYSETSEDGSDEDDYEEEEVEEKPVKKSKAKAAPRKSDVKSTPAKEAGKAKLATSGKGKDVKSEDGGETKPKFNWAAAKAAKLAGPSAPGTKQIPENASPDCLAGLSFVFTGELTAFSRDEAVEMAKRFGGRVTLQPSSKTSFVVLGDNAGPSKLAALKKHNLKTLSEDEFLNLIATRSPKLSDLDEKTIKKREKEQEAIKQGAKEMEKREKKAMKEIASGTTGSAKVFDASTQLWTTRYAPQSLKEICGNKGQVEKLQQWLHDWQGSLKSHFKKPGKNGMNVFRAVLITGPPGIGKTTSAHLVAKLEGLTPIELNASDARSKKLVENSTNIMNASLDGWMGGGNMKNVAGVEITDKSCLIMDEVDGMSAGDRGGVGALNQLIKKTRIPIICIANDKGAQKLKPLVATTFNLPFRRPDAAAIRSRLLTIAYKEKMKVPSNVIDELVTGAQSDIRQVLNMLSTWKLSSSTMDFDEGKNLVKMNEKYSIMTPFNVTAKLLGPYVFSATSRESLGDKQQYYFHDPSFMPLFIQENYLRAQPAQIRNLDGPPQALKALELLDQAASSISDGDMIDAMIHGPEQHWSLMPLHAICSTVRPASFMFGSCQAYGGPSAIAFPQWLGQNSKQNKLSRQLNDVQVRMRLKVSGNKSEIRQSYIPALFPHIVMPLMETGASAVEDVIEHMDEYYLSREDWDTIVELGVDSHRDELVLKKISTATKTSFTKKYNGREHPIPFHKATDLGKAPKKIAAHEAPDLEEAFDIDDDGDEPAEEVKSSSQDDIARDSLIKVPKAKKLSEPKGKAKAKAKGKS
ncbi:hypothetical protein JAAARDRAFT_210788 [Jaapia argillacea MUCL 33604]|uniref:Replication factor C subunit 1 n=1 Tax=Jaapia argillacea MUCL 33604 TaxID=933084 RepID=A0A067PBA6_9AGAM|nr:hypothetical protein JAAARDRAFT_210788 [Jaapia argillacea MUCL 33604]